VPTGLTEAKSARGDSDWHKSLGYTPRGAATPAAAQTPGMARYEAISGGMSGSENLWMGETHVGAGVSSGDHHHGSSETAIFVVSGHPVFVFLERGNELRRIETAPGDYVYVPPWTPHREENPGDEDAVVVLARSTQEAIVVNVEDLGFRPSP
jgi:uncharacterized RmlC-like cupin family protein